MKRWRKILVGGISLIMFLGALTSCATQKTEKKQITLRIKLPPLTVANANTGITDFYDVLTQAGKEFAAQHEDYDVTV